MLRDLWVVSVADNCARRRSLAEKKLNFNQARQIAQAMESADKNVPNIAACSNTTTLTQPNISCIDGGNSGRGKSKKTCFQFDSKRSLDYCHFRDATCNFSQKTGHISATCLKKESTKGTRNSWTHKVDRDEHDNETLSITPGDTASVHKLICILQKKIILQWYWLASVKDG